MPEENSLFEIVIDVFYYSHYAKLVRYFDKKNKYVALRDKLIGKFWIKYPQMSDEEFSVLWASILSMRQSKIITRKMIFYMTEEFHFNRISFVGPYLQEKGDYKYWWLIENMEEGIHHSWLHFFWKGNNIFTFFLTCNYCSILVNKIYNNRSMFNAISFLFYFVQLLHSKITK